MVTYPVLLVTTLQDPICLPSMAIASATPWCSNLTVRELDTGHWVMLEKPDELNATIDEFLQGLAA
jgi:soluble epoxide hydrolase/lipid-phosphate phosphatase